MPNRLARPILTATLVAGTLDISAAIILSLIYGRQPSNMLRFVASGAFPQATDWGAGGAALGLATHFILMAIMAILFMLAASRRRALRTHPLRWGLLYGLATYVVMNLIVVPLRFPAAFPPRPISVATQLFCHIVLVGIPIAWIAARHFRGRSAFA
jgi:hypothetical protein